MAVITMRQMLEAGVHFGHQTRRWNPKMKRFIFGERNGIYIIDLEQTLTRVEIAYNFVRDLVAGGGTSCSSGPRSRPRTRCAATPRSAACRTSTSAGSAACSPTSRPCPSGSARCSSTSGCGVSGEFEAMPKKEALLLDRELEKLQRNLGGIRGMKQRPDAVFVLDTKKEHIAVTEANKLGIPVVAVVDTNVDPDVVQFPIPGNDDAIRANSLMCRVIAEAVEEGRFIAAKRNPSPGAAASAAPRRRPRSRAQQADARTPGRRRPGRARRRAAGAQPDPPTTTPTDDGAAVDRRASRCRRDRRSGGRGRDGRGCRGAGRGRRRPRPTPSRADGGRRAGNRRDRRPLVEPPTADDRSPDRAVHRDRAEPKS